MNAANVLKSGKTYSELKDGINKTNRPDIYVEAYAPVIREGKVIAVSEVYINEITTAALIFEDFLYFGLTIAALVGFVVAIPLAAVAFITFELKNVMQNWIKNAFVPCEPSVRNQLSWHT